MFTSRPAQQVVLAIGIGVLVGCVFGAIAIGVMVAPNIMRAAFAPSPTPAYTATLPVFPTITLAAPAAPTLTYTVTPPVSPTLTPTAPASRTPTYAATRPALPTITLAPTPSRTPTHAPPPTTPANSTSRTPMPVVQHFLLGRPVLPPAERLWPSTVYLYGTTRLGDLDVHHGEEFENRTGTPVYAIGDGTIVVAGTDNVPMCGDEGNKVCGRDLSPDTGGFYGKVIVLQLAQSYNGQKVFALYGHLSKIGVAKGDVVQRGDPIGEIGMTGVADGPHVHFEVRLGVNDYAHTRNPILWMTPLPGRGALVGRYADAKGAPIHGVVINLYRAEPENFLYSTETYGRDKYPKVNSDDDLGENLAMPDLAPGEYIVRVRGQPFAARVTIKEGILAFVEIGFPPPPTVTPTSAVTPTP